MQIEKGSRLVMIGDSITDCGRARPVGERVFGGLGQGYVMMVDAIFAAAFPERRIEVFNTGISGNTVRDLKARRQSDIFDLQPHWLSIMIGTNDVWRQFDSPDNKASHVYPEEYEETLEELVAEAKPLVKRLVLMTPFYIEPNRAEGMRARMDEYGAIVKKIGAKHGAAVADTQAAFDSLLEYLPFTALAGDRVHPTAPGHMALARAFLEAAGFSWGGESATE